MSAIVHATPNSYELSFSGVDAAGFGTFMWAQVNDPAKLTDALASTAAVCVLEWLVVAAFKKCCLLARFHYWRKPKLCAKTVSGGRRSSGRQTVCTSAGKRCVRVERGHVAYMLHNCVSYASPIQYLLSCYKYHGNEANQKDDTDP